MADVTIVILSFNTATLTIRAVESCLALHSPDIQVVVVDNASTDDTVPALQKLLKKEKRLSLLTLKENLGFAAGNNAALKSIQTPYTFLLNSDAYFSPDFQLDVLLTYMNDHDDVGVVSPFVQLPTGQLDPASHRGFPTPWNAVCYFSGLETVTKNTRFAPWFGGYHQTWKDRTTVHDIEACTGAAMLVRTKAIEEVGLFDEAFFMYGEDLDWCYRFWQKNWKIVFYPDEIVMHDKHSSGLKKGHSHSRHAFYEAMKLFYKKHYRDRYPSFVYTLTMFGIDIKERLS